MNVVVPIIILVTSTIVIAIILANKNNNNNHIVPPTPDMTKEICNVSVDITQLKSCDPTNQDTCNNCHGGLHSCFTVDKNNPYQYAVEKNIVDLPDGKWCLPSKITSLPCNEFTGFPVLTKLNDTEYAWRCQCKNRSLFTNKGEFGDCIQEVSCGASEDLGQLVCPPGTDKCTSGKPWVDEPIWDPIYGVCNCKNGTTYVDQSNATDGIWSKMCLYDSCTPGTKKLNDGECDCSTNINKLVQKDIKDVKKSNIVKVGIEVILFILSIFLVIKIFKATLITILLITVIVSLFIWYKKKYTDITSLKLLQSQQIGSGAPYKTLIRCPTDIPDVNKHLCSTDRKQCVTDPCNPGGYYKPSPSGGACVCDESAGYTTAQNSNSIVKSICDSPCGPGRNPCSKRGTCVIDKSTGKALCDYCKSPYFQDDTNMCKTVKSIFGSGCSKDSQCISNNCGHDPWDPFGWGPATCH